MTAADSPETVQRPEEKTGENTRGEKETNRRQEKETMPDKKETVRTTPPLTGDWSVFVGYEVLFLVSVFLFLLLFLWRCVFG